MLLATVLRPRARRGFATPPASPFSRPSSRGERTVLKPKEMRGRKRNRTSQTQHSLIPWSTVGRGSCVPVWALGATLNARALLNAAPGTHRPTPWVAEPALGTLTVGASRAMEAAAAPVDVDAHAAAGFMHHVAPVGAAAEVNERQRTAELLSAAEFGNVAALERCLATECSPDLHDDAGRTALWLACWEGHLQAVQCLVEAGATIELPDIEETTPFSVACENGRIDIVRYLAKVAGLWRGLRQDRRVDRDRGVSRTALDPERPDADLCTPFFRACLLGRLEVVQFLAEELRVDTARVDRDGNSPFLMACQEGHVDVIQYLSGPTCNVNAERPSFGGWTPFSCACFQGRLDVVRYLSGIGVDMERTDDRGFSPFHAACQEGHLLVAKFLADKLGSKLNPDHGNNLGATAFFLACGKGHLAVVRFLADELGVDVTKARNNGRTPFYVACRYGNLDVVRYCAEHLRIDIDQKLGHREIPATPLHVACARGQVDVVRFLLDRGVCVSHSEDDGITPLLQAAHKAKPRQEKEEIIVLLTRTTTVPSSWPGLVAARQRLCFAMLLHRRLRCVSTCQDRASLRRGTPTTPPLATASSPPSGFPRTRVLQESASHAAGCHRALHLPCSGLADVFRVVESWMPRACGYSVLWRRQDEVVALGPWHHAYTEDDEEDEDCGGNGAEGRLLLGPGRTSRKRPRRAEAGGSVARLAASAHKVRKSPTHGYLHDAQPR